MQRLIFAPRLRGCRVQKEGYDLFREQLLPGRGCMVNLLPVLKAVEGLQKVLKYVLFMFVCIFFSVVTIVLGRSPPFWVANTHNIATFSDPSIISRRGRQVFAFGNLSQRIDGKIS